MRGPRREQVSPPRALAPLTAHAADQAFQALVPAGREARQLRAILNIPQPREAGLAGARPGATKLPRGERRRAVTAVNYRTPAAQYASSTVAGKKEDSP